MVSVKIQNMEIISTAGGLNCIIATVIQAEKMRQFFMQRETSGGNFLENQNWNWYTDRAHDLVTL